MVKMIKYPKVSGCQTLVRRTYHRAALILRKTYLVGHSYTIVPRPTTTQYQTHLSQKTAEVGAQCKIGKQ